MLPSLKEEIDMSTKLQTPSKSVERLFPMVLITHKIFFPLQLLRQCTTFSNPDNPFAVILAWENDIMVQYLVPIPCLSRRHLLPM
jgi:hypothetical protein